MSNRRPFPDDLNALFTEVDPLAFQQFAQAHQHWTMLQRIAELETQLTSLQEELAENDMQLKWLQPSAIALAAIARFQAYGVDDINLLDIMLERGETWLDQTLQLLEQCERLGLIGDGYTAWCEHALEGAYDWIASMHGSGEDAESAAAEMVEQVQQNDHQQLSPEVTEKMLIQRLMSEDESEKLATPVSPPVDTEQDAVAIASPSNSDIAEVQDEPALIDAVSTTRPLNEHNDSVIETLEPVVATSFETFPTSETAQEHLASSETLATPESLASSDAPLEAPAAPELLEAAGPWLETPAASGPLEASGTSVEASDTPELPGGSDISSEPPTASEAIEALDTSVEALETPELLEVSDTSVEPPAASETSEDADTPVEALDTPEVSNEAPEEILQTEAATTPTETPTLLEEPAWSVEAPPTEEMAADFVDAAEPLYANIDVDFPQIAEAEEISVETAQVPESVEMPDEQPTEPQLAAFILPTPESDPLDEPAKYPAQPEEQNDLFNEYIEAAATDDPGFNSINVHDDLVHDPEFASAAVHDDLVHDPEFASAAVHTDPIDDPDLDATSTPTEPVHDPEFDSDSAHVKAVDEEQNDPFTVDGTVTYLPSSNPGVQATTATVISKPKRRFFLWRLLARLFRRPSKRSL